MKKKIFLIILVLMELLFLQQWTACVRFAEQFHFSPFDLSLRLIEGIHNDNNVPLFFVRLFHNKILGTVIDIYNDYAHYWDVVFLIQLLSLIGFFGLICGIWYIFQVKVGKWARILLAISLFVPIIEIILPVHFSFMVQLGLFAAPLLALTFLGWRYFLSVEGKLRYGIFLSLELLSILWLYGTLLQPNLTYCLK